MNDNYNNNHNPYIDRGGQPQGMSPQQPQPARAPWQPAQPQTPYDPAAAGRGSQPVEEPVNSAGVNPQNSTPNAYAATGATDSGFPPAGPTPGEQQAAFPGAPVQPYAANEIPQAHTDVPVAGVPAFPGSVPGQPVLRIEAPYTGAGAAAGFHTPNPSGSAGYTADAGPACTGQPATTGDLSPGGSGGPGGGNHDNKKRGRIGKGVIAAMLALSLVTGSAGGGATYYLLQQTNGAQTSSSVQASADAAATQTNVTNLQSSDITRVVEKAASSVVEITCEVKMSGFFTGYASESSGSGVIVSEDGYVVTNDHVIDGASAITVRTSDGEEYAATLVGTDSKTDIAVLKIDASGLNAAQFADSSQIVVGQLAIAIGNPLGTLGGTVTDGIISGLDREITVGDETMTLIQTSAAVNPGNSGGGLFDADGNLVGIVNSKSYGIEVEGLGFAIPSNTAAAVIDDLLTNGYVTGRPQLGIQIVDILDQQAMLHYGVSEPGVYIDQVNRDIDLEPGDRIVQVNGQEITSGSELKEMVSAGEVGDVMEFVVERGGRRVSVSVELAEQVPVQQTVSAEA